MNKLFTRTRSRYETDENRNLRVQLAIRGRLARAKILAPEPTEPMTNTLSTLFSRRTVALAILSIGVGVALSLFSVVQIST